MAITTHPGNDQEQPLTCDHLKALELAKSGEWDAAHKLVQDDSDEKSCLIHAYLHRVEGDLNNARYWYNKAHQQMPDNSLEEELKRLDQLVNSP